MLGGGCWVVATVTLRLESGSPFKGDGLLGLVRQYGELRKAAASGPALEGAHMYGQFGAHAGHG